MLAKNAVQFRLIVSDALSREEKTQAMIIAVIFCVQMDACVGLNLCVLSEIYESETRDAQVD